MCTPTRLFALIVVAKRNAIIQVRCIRRRVQRVKNAREIVKLVAVAGEIKNLCVKSTQCESVAVGFYFLCVYARPRDIIIYSCVYAYAKG